MLTIMLIMGIIVCHYHVIMSHVIVTLTSIELSKVVKKRNNATLGSNTTVYLIR